jgi:hypothetical protein
MQAPEGIAFMPQTRKRPWIGTTVSPDMFALLQEEKVRDSRPLSYVLDNVIQSWATTGARVEQLKHRLALVDGTREQLEQRVGHLESAMQALGKYLDKAAP